MSGPRQPVTGEGHVLKIAYNAGGQEARAALDDACQAVKARHAGVVGEAWVEPVGGSADSSDAALAALDQALTEADNDQRGGSYRLHTLLWALEQRGFRLAALSSRQQPEGMAAALKVIEGVRDGRLAPAALDEVLQWFELHPPSQPVPGGLTPEKELTELRESVAARERLRLEYLDRAERAETLLREVARSGVAFEDGRLSYVEVQIDRETWGQIAGQDTEGSQREPLSNSTYNTERSLDDQA